MVVKVKGKEKVGEGRVPLVRGRSREKITVPFFFPEDECSVIGSFVFCPL